jgi:hypothetical protein
MRSEKGEGTNLKNSVWLESVIARVHFVLNLRFFLSLTCLRVLAVFVYVDAFRF